MAANRRSVAGASEILPPFKYFVKAISPESVERRRMMLPEKFVRTFQNRIPAVAKLRAPDGGVWNVGLSREQGNRNRVWLDAGFGDFLDHHSILPRHVVMLKYDGDSGFKFVVCDHTACEVVFPDAEPQPASEDDDNEDSEFHGETSEEEEEEEHSEIDGDEEELGLHGRSFAGASEILPPFKYFFKAISPETVGRRRMMLPEKFVRVFQDRIPAVAKLRVPNGGVWNVGLSREQGNRNRVWLRLDSGFGDFLDHHSILGYHLVMFKYDGDSGFKVVIFDHTACEVVFPDAEPLPSSEDDDDEDSEFYGETSEEEEDEEEKDSETDSDDEEELCFCGRNTGSTNRKRKRVVNGYRPRRNASGSRRRATTGPDAGVRASGRGRRVAAGRNGASESRQRRQNRHRASKPVIQGRDGVLWRRLVTARIATTNKFASDLQNLSERSKIAVEKAIRCSNRRNPSALVVMMGFHIYPGIMYLPTKFAVKYFPRDSERVMLRAYEENGEFVYESAIYTTRNEKNVLFLLSWGKFAQINRLVEGDVCLIELIRKKNKKVLRFHIFRAYAI